MEDRPLRDDEYPEDETETPARLPQEFDPISAALGTGAFVYLHVVPECVERYAGRVARFPDRFDRYYFDTPHGPVLVDVIADATDEQRLRDIASKHVEFKRKWCAENDRRYLVVGESQASNARAVAALIADEPESSEPRRTPSAAAKSRRGKIQRPKATV